MKKQINSPKDFKFTKADLPFVRALVESVAESALINGKINIGDFSDKKLLLKKLIRIIPKEDEKFFSVVVYLPFLLEKAEKSVRNKEYELAYVFYATYFEHFINEIISIWSQRNFVKYQTASNLVKKVSLEDKYDWVLDLLKLPSFKKIYWKTIKNVSDKRNSFMHYKYKPEPADAALDKKELIKWREDYENILKTITYTKFYRSKVVFDGKKKKFKI